MSITTDENLEWTKDRTFGEGFIEKSGNGTIEMSGDNSSFNGLFFQTAGTTTVKAKYFSGISSITKGSVLEFVEASSITEKTKLEIWNSTMTINSSLNWSFGNSALAGNGVVFKNNDKVLNVDGNNEAFKGVFTQTAGTTTVRGVYFSGVSSITKNSLLEFIDASTITQNTKLQIWDSTMTINTDVDWTFGNNTHAGYGLVFKIKDK
jgi:hypothetical protein